MKVILLDRDGVINHDSVDFIKSAAEWQPIEGSLEAIARLSRAGWRVFVCSNQSGIGRGLFSFDQLFAIHDALHSGVAALGGRIDGIVYCPHDPDADCACRKPKPGMLLEVAKRLNLDTLQGVSMVGDSLRDLEAARVAGATPVLVKTGNGSKTLRHHAKQLEGVAVYDDLAAVVQAMLAG